MNMYEADRRALRQMFAIVTDEEKQLAAQPENWIKRTIFQALAVDPLAAIYDIWLFDGAMETIIERSNGTTEFYVSYGY